VRFEYRREATIVVLNIEDEKTTSAIARGLGDELRSRREAQGWSRAAFVRRLPSGIGDRTLLAYEHGLRQLTVVRLIELSQGLEVGAPIVLGQGLQRAEVTLQDIPLRVDLSQLLRTTSMNVRPLHQWAKNRMRDSENGVAEVMPSGVKELAASVGFLHQDVASQLATFIPAS
jgi:transcriptional regulator with XRE-family HTH domain